MINFILGFVLGGFFGMFITILLVLSGKDDNNAE